MSIQVGRGKRQMLAKTLSRRIRDGDYEPGQKLAEEYGGSRGIIQPALSELQYRA